MAVTKTRAYAVAALFLLVVPFTVLHLAKGLSRHWSSSETLGENDNAGRFHPIGNQTLGVSNFSTICLHPER